ncbi:FAS1 domain-containing protein SELMODRAFT_448915-like [Phoenix dactylifera]|uniref:FAS1 domain-containing protein SELMODRAFT_448915-like n=1 Tax=Phoenix dactylifera TaxID=42345 RepID=A0A8B8JCB9_PHODC|nr:FAS1 domain-containing protein SELMODRAFT_448915-like [Phoenix dactylifera]
MSSRGINRFSMTAYLTSNLLMVLIISASALDEPSQKTKDIIVAVQEMQRANFFTFVMLINMAKDEIPSNTTFLMPSDRMLSKASIPQNKVMEFLSRHSMPSPLLFEDLKRLPSGTIIPTYQQDYKIRIYNKGRKRLYLNNIELVRPNICTAGTSFRCHGINGIMKAAMPRRDTPATCSNATPPTAKTEPPSAPPSAQPPPPPPPLVGTPSTKPTISPAPVQFDDGPRKSGTSKLHSPGLFTATVSCMIFSVMKLPI